MLFRKIESILNEYYKNPKDKILVIDGARQIGKSFIIRETASKYFKHYVEINLKDDFLGDKKFEKIKTVDDFYIRISADYGNNINNFDDTIIFLDEIQTYPHLLSMLKPLKKDDKYRYIASGSLLGVTLKHTFIPMGSIHEVNMYPLDFEEFLIARGVGKESIDYLRNCFIKKEKVNDSIHETFLRYFKEYLICGGLPEAVNEYVTSKNIYKVREIQNDIYKYYKDDASQYDIEHNLKIRTIYDFLPSYMENKVKRVKFRSIESDVKASLLKYEDEFDYLVYSGCALSAKAISDPKFPLLETASKNLIKLYYNDVGILSSILYDKKIECILNEDNSINLGSVYETACAMELKAHGHDLYYFDSKKVGEVDFLINNYDTLSILPIEIKSGNNQNNFRAIPKLVEEPYSLKEGYIFGNKNIVLKKDKLFIYPIYMIMFV